MMVAICMQPLHCIDLLKTSYLLLVGRSAD